jgi:hypothetical protein
MREGKMREMARGGVMVGLMVARHFLRYVSYQVASRR